MGEIRIKLEEDFTDLWLLEFLNYERATFFEEKSFYSPCSNFVATLLLSTKMSSQTLKNIICKVFLALPNPFNYFCVVLVTNVHRNRHISFRAFSKVILYWNLDNFDTGVMSKKRPRLWYLYTLNRAIISLGVGFAYYQCQAVQSLNRIIS